MMIHKGRQEQALLQKTNSPKILNDRQKRKGVHGFIGYRFFLTLFSAFLICLSISMPNWGRQPEYDFKIAGVNPISQSNIKPDGDNEKLSVDSFVVSLMKTNFRNNFNEGATANRGGDYAEGRGEGTSGGDYAEGRGENAADWGEDTEGRGGDFIAITGGGEELPMAFLSGGALYDGEAQPPRANGGAGIVVLDAGHGGSDPGSIEAGVCEKDIALAVAARTAEILDESGIEFAMTRAGDDDIAFDDRINAARDEDAAFMISIHCDWFIDKSVNGTSVLYSDENISSKKLAILMQSYMTEGLGTLNRSIHPHSNVILLREAAIPSVVIELGFISSAHDFSMMITDEFKNQAAINLANGIIAAIGNIDAIIAD